jgi:hypothetical protein
MTTDATPTRTAAEMWFDPTCPWAWMTSRWLMEAAQVRDLDITWSVMSLSVLNQGRELNEDYAALMERAWAPVRLVLAAGREHPGDDDGSTTRKRLYDALGTRIHNEGRGTEDLAAIIPEALEEAGLPAELARYADSDELDEQLRASHQRAIDLVGDDVGTPVVSVNGVSFFGPVVTPAPKREAAGRLWDGCVLVAGTPGFYEIKRSRDASPDFS